MEQEREDYRERERRPTRLPPTWVLTLLAFFLIGLGLVLIDVLTVAALRKP